MRLFMCAFLLFTMTCCLGGSCSDAPMSRSQQCLQDCDDGCREDPTVADVAVCYDQCETDCNIRSATCKKECAPMCDGGIDCECYRHCVGVVGD